MKKKKAWIFVLSFFILVMIAILVLVWLQTQSKNKPEEVLTTYMGYIEQKNYEAMYEMLSQKSKDLITKEDFVARNRNIYEGIEISNLQVRITKVEKKDKDHTEIVYGTVMNTVAGELSFSNTAEFIRNTDREYQLQWSSHLIFPELAEEYKVRVSTLPAKRGTIYDRNDIVIAQEGIASQIGFVPGKMQTDTKESDIQKVSDLLGISVDSIKDSLSASYVKEDTFVPLKTVLKSEQELKDQLLTIKGIKIIDATERIYPYGEATSQLLGYVQTDIGKAGLEKQYEDTLKGIDGAEIYIEDEQGNKKKTLVKENLKNGEDLKLTIDVKLQQKAYEQFKEDKSAVVAMNYETGELLALISTPTFNSNDFSLGMTTAKWDELSQNAEKPLFNRYLASYAPGSSFKPIIGAIGLTEAAFSAEEDFGVSGTKWQNSSSWGDFYITTLATYAGPANLKNAFVYSDNIYFAKAALKIGEETMVKSLKQLGFGEQIPFIQEMEKSTYSNQEGFRNETQLANTGYGQGEVLVNPIHMAMLYSSIANNGNMVQPYIKYQEQAKGTYYKEGVFSKEAAQTIQEAMVQVVENPNGTGHSAQIKGKTIAGKTGTAEIKTTKEDKEGTEIGWFNAFEVGENPLLVISMVEEVKGKGGSHYVVPKVKSIFEN